MNQNSRNKSSQEHGTGRLRTHLWKRVIPAVLAAIMVMGASGCALDDLTSGAGGDVPFEQDQQIPEMDVIENAPTVADDASFGGFASGPLVPLN